MFSALLMGVAGSVHCVAMCGASSAAVVRACGGRTVSTWTGFHLGRLTGYALAGAMAAASVGVLGRLGQWSPALRPLWTLTHLAALALGLWLLWQGRQPPWLDRLGRQGQRVGSVGSSGWQALRGPLKAGAAGSIWFAWPCGLLQSALMVAALANGPLGGAAVMAVFALSSAWALGLGSALWLRSLGPEGTGSSGAGRQIMTWVTRLSGAALASASAWALGHGLWERFAAWCFA
jgi:sulfite exporter TauE/SafE